MINIINGYRFLIDFFVMNLTAAGSDKDNKVVVYILQDVKKFKHFNSARIANQRSVVSFLKNEPLLLDLHFTHWRCRGEAFLAGNKNSICTYNKNASPYVHLQQHSYF